MLFCGIPVFLLEVAIGQYLGAGGMTTIAQICPILKGEKDNDSKTGPVKFIIWGQEFESQPHYRVNSSWNVVIGREKTNKNTLVVLAAYIMTIWTTMTANQDMSSSLSFVLA